MGTFLETNTTMNVFLMIELWTIVTNSLSEDVGVINRNLDADTLPLCRRKCQFICFPSFKDLTVTSKPQLQCAKAKPSSVLLQPVLFPLFSFLFLLLFLPLTGTEVH